MGGDPHGIAIPEVEECVLRFASLTTLGRLVGLLPEAALLAGAAVVAARALRGWREDGRLAVRLLTQWPPVPELSSTPKVSVLMAAWNEGERVEEAIQSFQSLRYADKEMVVCAGGAGDTYSRAAAYQGNGVTVLEQFQGEGKQGALRRCFEKCTGEIVFLTDADCLLDDEAFARTLAPIVNDGEDAATGLFRPPREMRPHDSFLLYQWFWNTYTAAKSPDYLPGLLGTNAAVRRGAIEKAGALQTQISTGTDYYMAKELIAAGYTIRFAKHSEIKTKYPNGYTAYRLQQSRWLKNVVLHGLRFGSLSEVISCLRTSFIGLGMLLFPLTFPFSKRLGIYMWLVALLYGYLSRLRVVRFGEIYTGVSFPAAAYPKLLLFMFGDFLAWGYTLVEYLSPDLRKRW